MIDVEVDLLTRNIYNNTKNIASFQTREKNNHCIVVNGNLTRDRTGLWAHFIVLSTLAGSNIQGI